MITIVGADGSHAARSGDAWVLDEAAGWVVCAPEGAVVTMAERRLAWSAQHKGFHVHLPFAVGRLTLRVTFGGATSEYPVVIQPTPAKLKPDLWATMLRELEAWLPSVGVGVQAPQGGSVGLDGVASVRLAEAVLPLLDSWERALRRVIGRPRVRVRHPIEDVPLHRTHAADRETVAWLARHPTDAAWLDPAKNLELEGLPPEVPQRTVEDTLDHPANRHLAWLCVRVHRTLHAAAAALRQVKQDELNDTIAWCEGRAAALDAAAERIDRLRRRSFLGGLRPAPATGSALLVVRDDPAYARVHRLGRLILAPRFQHAEGTLTASTRPTFELYEIWCFLAVQRALAQQLGASVRWASTKMERLLEGGTGEGARFDGHGSNLAVSILFNPTFSSWMARVSNKRRSVSRERRPDVVVTWREGAHTAWVALDAKYRVGHDALGKAFDSAHGYHDALRWPEFGDTCRAAVLLSPQRTGDAAAWFEPGFRDEQRVGVFAVAPGGGPWNELGRWIVETLREVSKNTVRRDPSGEGSAEEGGDSAGKLWRGHERC